jgi:hypothetical protein
VWVRQNEYKIYYEENLMTKPSEDMKTKTLAETENYIAWEVEEPDGEITYHLQLNNLTVHFFKEEWGELLELIQKFE